MYHIIIYYFNRSFTLLLVRLRRLSGASYPGGTDQPQSHIHQGRHLRGQTEMASATTVIGSTVGRKKLEKQTQTRVNLCVIYYICILLCIYTRGKNKSWLYYLKKKVCRHRGISFEKLHFSRINLKSNLI